MDSIFGSVGDLTQLWPLLFMIVLFYFILYRPQKKQQKRRQEMFESLKKNTRIVTIGGIIGTITDIKEDYIRLRVADKVEIKMTKGAVRAVLGAEEESN